MKMKHVGPTLMFLLGLYMVVIAVEGIWRAYHHRGGAYVEEDWGTEWQAEGQYKRSQYTGAVLVLLVGGMFCYYPFIRPPRFCS